ncbi:uncharacterized protein VTP21DRAFT_9284 [Calcarisporiella thermophila]|uniref:uncharacterized protein n=1 Tax=Calcarisporiella thermophila TaxID=911321 RepID=UPI0037435BB5
MTSIVPLISMGLLRLWFLALFSCCVVCYGRDHVSKRAQRVGDNMTRVLGVGGSFPLSIYNLWAVSYNQQRKNEGVEVRYDARGSVAGIEAILEPGIVEFAGSESMLNESSYTAGGDLQMLPVLAGAVTIAYNVPEMISANYQLQLSREAIVGIFNGTILSWSHPMIQQANPTFKLPDQPIRLVARKDSSGTTKLFTAALSSFSPDWARTIGSNELPKWPRIDITAPLNSGVAKFIYALNYSIGYLDDADSHENGLSHAMVINRQGRPTWPNNTSISSAMNDFQEALYQSPTFTTSLIDGPGEASYPICGFTYYIMHRRNWTTEEIARMTLRYIWWTYTDPYALQVVQQSRFVGPVPQIRERVLEILRTDFTFGGQPLYGRSPCDTGCANGNCLTDGAFHAPSEQCVCPSQFENVLSGDCSEPVTPVTIEYGSVAGVVFIVLTLLVFCAVAGLMAVIWRFREHLVVRSSSPLFMGLMALGLMLALTNVFFYMGQLSPWKCIVLPYVLSCSFGLVFGMLLAKTYRIYEIFENPLLINKAIPDKNLLMFGGTILAFEIVLVTIWMAVDYPKPSMITTAAGEHSQVCNSASSPLQITMLTLLYGFNALLLVCCIYLAWKTRGVHSFFNESRIISFCVYLVSIPTIILLPVVYIPNIGVYAQFSLRTTVVLICVVATTLLLFVTKVRLLLWPPRDPEGSTTSGRVSDSLMLFEDPNDPASRFIFSEGTRVNTATGSLAELHLPTAATPREQSPKQSPVDQRWTKNVQLSRWNFLMKRCRPFFPWRRVCFMLLKEYDVLMILRRMPDGSAKCMHIFHASALSFHMTDDPCRGVLKSQAGTWFLETKRREDIAAFLQIFSDRNRGLDGENRPLDGQTSKPSTTPGVTAADGRASYSDHFSPTSTLNAPFMLSQSRASPSSPFILNRQLQRLASAPGNLSHSPSSSNLQGSPEGFGSQRRKKMADILEMDILSDDEDSHGGSRRKSTANARAGPANSRPESEKH